MSSAAFRVRPRAAPSPSRDSPMRLQACSQMWFDPILRASRCRLPASSCVTARGSKSFEDTGDGVTAEIVDLESGGRERIEADYLVGCDGAMSAIRGAARHRARRAGRARPSAASVLPRARSAQARRQGGGHVLSRHRPRRAVGQYPRHRSGQRHVAADGARHRRQADAGEHRPGRADPPRGRAAARGRVARRQHLDPAQRGRRALSTRAGCFSQATRCINCRRPAPSA